MTVSGNVKIVMMEHLWCDVFVVAVLIQKQLLLNIHIYRLLHCCDPSLGSLTLRIFDPHLKFLSGALLPSISLPPLPPALPHPFLSSLPSIPLSLPLLPSQPNIVTNKVTLFFFFLRSAIVHTVSYHQPFFGILREEILH